MITQPAYGDVALATFTPDSPLFAEVAEVFRATWPDRFFSTSDAAARIRQHACYDGFRGIAAVSAGHVIGFVYGYTNAPGQWWYDQIVQHAPRLSVKLNLADSFAFTELAVAASWRRHGVGQRLHDAVLRDLPHRYTVLSTQTDNVAALALYRHLGWDVLIPGMRFDGNAPDFAILGKALK
jgi:ribosomal protein S18 acetylase RimI-like enzyme